MTQDDIIRMARESGKSESWVTGKTILPFVERFAAFVAAAEREECAKAVERSYLSVDGSHGVGDHDWHIAERVTAHCAVAIRSREKQ